MWLIKGPFTWLFAPKKDYRQVAPYDGVSAEFDRISGERKAKPIEGKSCNKPQVYGSFHLELHVGMLSYLVDVEICVRANSNEYLEFLDPSFCVTLKSLPEKLLSSSPSGSYLEDSIKSFLCSGTNYDDNLVGDSLSGLVSLLECYDQISFSESRWSTQGIFVAVDIIISSLCTTLQAKPPGKSIDTLHKCAQSLESIMRLLVDNVSMNISSNDFTDDMAMTWGQIAGKCFKTVLIVNSQMGTYIEECRHQNSLDKEVVQMVVSCMTDVARLLSCFIKLLSHSRLRVSSSSHQPLTLMFWMACDMTAKILVSLRPYVEGQLTAASGEHPSDKTDASAPAQDRKFWRQMDCVVTQLMTKTIIGLSCAVMEPSQFVLLVTQAIESGKVDFIMQYGSGPRRACAPGQANTLSDQARASNTSATFDTAPSNTIIIGSRDSHAPEQFTKRLEDLNFALLGFSKLLDLTNDCSSSSSTRNVINLPMYKEWISALARSALSIISWCVDSTQYGGRTGSKYQGSFAATSLDCKRELLKIAAYMATKLLELVYLSPIFILEDSDSHIFLECAMKLNDFLELKKQLRLNQQHCLKQARVESSKSVPMSRGLINSISPLALALTPNTESPNVPRPTSGLNSGLPPSSFSDHSGRRSHSPFCEVVAGAAGTGQTGGVVPPPNVPNLSLNHSLGHAHNAHSLSTTARSTARKMYFTVGEVVDGLCQLANGSERWFPAVIASISANSSGTQTYELKFDDGEIQVKDASMIREPRVRKTARTRGNSVSGSSPLQPIETREAINSLTRKSPIRTASENECTMPPVNAIKSGEKPMPRLSADLGGTSFELEGVEEVNVNNANEHDSDDDEAIFTIPSIFGVDRGKIAQSKQKSSSIPQIQFGKLEMGGSAPLSASGSSLSGMLLRESVNGDARPLTSHSATTMDLYNPPSNIAFNNIKGANHPLLQPLVFPNDKGVDRLGMSLPGTGRSADTSCLSFPDYNLDSTRSGNGIAGAKQWPSGSVPALFYSSREMQLTRQLQEHQLQYYGSSHPYTQMGSFRLLDGDLVNDMNKTMDVIAALLCVGAVRQRRRKADSAPPPPGGAISSPTGANTSTPLPVSADRVDRFFHGVHSLQRQMPPSQTTEQDYSQGSDPIVLETTTGPASSISILFTLREYIDATAICSANTDAMDESGNSLGEPNAAYNSNGVVNNERTAALTFSKLSSLMNIMGAGHSRLFKILSPLVHSVDPCFVTHLEHNAIQRLGDGAFGAVQKVTCCSACSGKARDLSYAVKRIPRERSLHDNSIHVLQFYNEVSCLELLASVGMANLGAGGVCSVVAYGVVSVEYCLVMECGVMNLREWRKECLLHTKKNHETEESVDADGVLVDDFLLVFGILHDITLIVKEVHEAGVVHFDLKCDNFILRRQPNLEELQRARQCHQTSGCVFLADFGESVRYSMVENMDDVEEVEEEVRCRGTLCIQCPEMIRANASEVGATGAVTEASGSHGCVKPLEAGRFNGMACDVWSIGCLMVELLSGEYMFGEASWAELYVMLCVDRVRSTPSSSSPSQWPIDIPATYLQKLQSSISAVVDHARMKDDLKVGGMLEHVYSMLRSTLVIAPSGRSTMQQLDDMFVEYSTQNHIGGKSATKERIDEKEKDQSQFNCRNCFTDTDLLFFDGVSSSNSLMVLLAVTGIAKDPLGGSSVGTRIVTPSSCFPIFDPLPPVTGMGFAADQLSSVVRVGLDVTIIEKVNIKEVPMSHCTTTGSGRTSNTLADFPSSSTIGGDMSESLSEYSRQLGVVVDMSTLSVVTLTLGHHCTKSLRGGGSSGSIPNMTEEAMLRAIPNGPIEMCLCFSAVHKAGNANHVLPSSMSLLSWPQSATCFYLTTTTCAKSSISLLVKEIVSLYHIVVSQLKLGRRINFNLEPAASTNHSDFNAEVMIVRGVAVALMMFIRAKWTFVGVEKYSSCTLTAEGVQRIAHQLKCLCNAPAIDQSFQISNYFLFQLCLEIGLDS